MRARTLLTMAAVTALSAVGIAPASAAPGDVGGEMCGQYENRLVGDNYISVNGWNLGPGQTQCIQPRENGFAITRDGGDSRGPGGTPASYSSLVRGFHRGLSTPNYTAYKAGEIPADLRTSAKITPAPGRWNASLDVWFDAQKQPAGQAGDLEIMAWFATKDAPQPIGNKVDTKTLDGRTYDIWKGKGPEGWDVVSYVDRANNFTPNVSIKALVDDSIARGAVERGSFMSSVQLGFEPASGGKGLAISDFTYGRSGTPTPTPTPTPEPSTPAPTQPPAASGVLGLAGLDRTIGTAGFNGARAELVNGNDGRAGFKLAGDSTVRKGGQCLDVAYASRQRGATVQGWPCATSNGKPVGQQTWTLEPNGTLRNPVSGKCLDVAYGTTNIGGKLQLWDCDPSKAWQRWSMR